MTTAAAQPGPVKTAEAAAVVISHVLSSSVGEKKCRAVKFH